MLIRQGPVWPLQGGKSLTFILAFIVEGMGWSIFSLVIFLPATVLGALQELFMIQLKHKCLEKP